MDLYTFDARLRSAVFANLTNLEIALRALIGHELGRIDPFIHLDSKKLNAVAKQPAKRGKKTETEYEIWRRKYDKALDLSREDFVEHHRSIYQGKLPIWVAVEVLDWGMLSYLYRYSPNRAQNRIARSCGMNAPQLASWLKSLNVLRNHSAHHGRLVTRVFDSKPKPIANPQMKTPFESFNRLFGQLSMILFLLEQLGIEQQINLREVLESFPHNPLVRFERTGTPAHWKYLALWSK